MFYLKYNIDYLNIVENLENQNSRVDFLIKNATIIVTQPFYACKRYYDYNKINELKNENCQLITVHVLYYDGYFPQTNILNYNEMEKNTELANKITENSNNSLKNLYNQENALDNHIKVDIPIFDFIKDNLQKKRLFLRINHPSNYLMNIYAYLIYKKIINDISYFKNNTLVTYNYNFDNFDNSCAILNTIETYEDIDTFTYESLKLEWNNNDLLTVKK